MPALPSSTDEGFPATTPPRLRRGRDPASTCYWYTALRSVAYGPWLAELEVRAIPDHDDRLGPAPEADDYGLLRDKLTAAVRAICPVWMLNSQDDIVQMAMMSVLRQQQKSEEKRQFATSYLKRAAFTALVDEIRRVRSRGETALEAADRELTLSRGPEHSYRAREISQGVRQCLGALSPPRRTAVTLHLLGYTVPQVAERTGWTRKQAENLVYRGMNDLRKCLRAKGLEP